MLRVGTSRIINKLEYGIVYQVLYFTVVYLLRLGTPRITLEYSIVQILYCTVV